MLSTKAIILELILGFESHVTWTFVTIRKTEKSKTSTVLKARSSVGRHHSMRVDEGRKGRSLLAIDHSTVSLTTNNAPTSTPHCPHSFRPQSMV